MTDHEHTTLTEVIREAYIGEPPYTLYEYTEEEFDRWLAERDARIIAAAEQRGAVMELREVANMSDAWQEFFRKDVNDQTAYMLAWRLRIALHNRADTCRADRIADKEAIDGN